MTHAEQSWADINQRCTDWWAQRPAPKVDEPKVLRTAAVIVDAQAVTDFAGWQIVWKRRSDGAN